MCETREITAEIRIVLEEFYNTLQGLRMINLRNRSSRSIYSAFAQFLQRFISNVFDKLLELGESSSAELVFSPEFSRTLIDRFRRIVRSHCNTLSTVIQDLDIIPVEVMNAFRGIHIYLFSEISKFFGALTKIVVLSQEEIARYNELISYFRPFHGMFYRVLQRMGISLDIRSRLDYLQFCQTYITRMSQTLIEMENPVQISEGLTQRVVEENTISYKYRKIQKCEDGEYHADSCTICISPLEEDEQARRLPCFHVYHTSCVDHWFRSNVSCPMCRVHIVEKHAEFVQRLKHCAVVE